MRKLAPLLLIIFFLKISNVVAQVNLQDSLALVDLYDSAGGNNWTNKWYFTENVIYWKGVQVTANRVTSITLRNNNLAGTIPASIGNLSELQSLTLAENHLTGSIPASMGQLSQLKMLDLDYNELSGSIPSSLGQLTGLENLWLYSNQLSGVIPPALGQLTNLLKLELSANQLTGTIPESLTNLANLKYLWLSGNQLSGPIPASLSQLTNLEQLYLSLNQFSGSIPPSLGQLGNLQKLVLGNNQFTDSIPSALGQLSNLTDLELDNNQLSGAVPSSLTHFSKFEQMYLFFNRFNFEGMEAMVTAYPNAFAYAPQANIELHDNNGKFAVTVGGTLSNNSYQWYRNNNLFKTITGDSTFDVESPGTYSVAVSNSIVTKFEYAYTNLVLYSDTIIVSDTAILADTPHVQYANREYTDKSGWTHYYFDNNTPTNYEDDTLLLSLNKHGQNIGTIGDGIFSVKLEATAKAGTDTAILLTNPLITNPTGYWVMNRYWQVNPTFEPSADIGVRFYYNNQDLNDINGSYPTHDLTNNQLIFYKSIGGNPDPTTNLEGATAIISIMPSNYASDSTWTYHQLTDSTQYAEFAVAGFSGGGGGGTGNHEALPLKLLSFTATKQSNNKVLLNWSTAQEINTASFYVERSVNGSDFMVIANEPAHGRTNANNYNFTDDLSAFANQYRTAFYRLKIFDKSGSFTYSEIRSIDLAGSFSISLRPNPVKNKLNISITAPANMILQVEVINLQGKRILLTDTNVAAGSSAQTIDVSSLAAGSYVLLIRSTQGKASLRFIKE